MSKEWTEFKDKEDMPLDTVLLVKLDTEDKMEKYQTSYFTRCENTSAIWGFVGGLNFKFKPKILQYKLLDIT